MNQKKSIALTTTFVGLVCGFVLTQQQAAAAATNAPDPTATSMVAPRSTATAKSAEPTQKEQPVNQQTSTQKSVTNTDNVSETANQNRISGTQSIGSSATTTTAQPATSSNNPTTSAQPPQETAAQNPAATSSANSANEVTQPVSQPTVPATPQATKVTNSTNTASTTTDSQVETIAQGTWGTSKWEYTHQGDDYILHFHAGTLGNSSHKTIKDPHSSYLQHTVGSIGASPEVFNGNWQWIEDLTQIVIDPGVKANQDSSYLFECLINLKKIIGLANLDTAGVTNMHGMFDFCKSLTSLDLNNFNTTNVTNMQGMFWSCSSLTNLDLSSFNTANVIDMADMFYMCPRLTVLDLSNFDTVKVIDMGSMFMNCERLSSLDLSSFNTAKVTDMSYMFANCEGLSSLDLSSFNTANVTDMQYMFFFCSGLTNLDLSNFNTAKVTKMEWMFVKCSKLTSLDLSQLNTAKAIDEIFHIFDSCDNLNHLILGPDTLFNTNAALPHIPKTSTQIPGKDRVVASPYWIATSGYQQGHKYTSTDLMELTGRDQVTTYDWDSEPAFTQTTETKTKVRTINLHQPNGQLKTETQTVAVSRPVTINPDGSRTYGAWTTAQWDQYTVPEWAGY
ncbi:putative surface protein, partial [Bombilactobacillus mellifer]